MSNPAARSFGCSTRVFGHQHSCITLPLRKKTGDGGNHVFLGSTGYMPHLFAIWVCLKNWVNHHFPYWNRRKLGNIISPYIILYRSLSHSIPTIIFTGHKFSWSNHNFSNFSCLKNTIFHGSTAIFPIFWWAKSPLGA